MKKQLLFFVLLCLSFVSHAQFQTPTPLVVCDDNNDQFSTFDLTTKIPEILGNENPNDYNVNFYSSFSDALNDANVISNPNNYVNVFSAVQTLGVRITNIITNSFDIVTLDVRVLPSPVFGAPILNACADNGVYVFDLSSVEEQILSPTNIDPGDLTLAFYMTEIDAQTNSNPLPYYYTTQEPLSVIYLKATIINFECDSVYALTLVGEDCGGGPCETPTNIFIEQTTSNSFNLDWSAVAGATYEVYVTAYDGPDPTPNTVGTSTGSVSNYAITNLDCNSVFKCFVRAICSNGGTSEWSSAILFETVDCTGGPCETPNNLVVTNVTSTSAIISWDGNLNTSWEIYLSDANSEAPTANTVGIAVNVNPYEVTGLVCGTAYKYYVRSLCDNEVSAWSGGFTFQTYGCNSFIPITVNNNATPAELVINVLLSNTCAVATNIVTQGSCGVGYFTNNGGQFPFAEGVVIRSGYVPNSGGAYTAVNESSSCSQTGDVDLTGIVASLGQSGTVTDATSVKFNFTAISNLLSFNFLFASNEYGSYQCNFSDVFGFILTDIETGVKQNIALVPGTNTPISTTTIRNNTHNGSCVSVNPQFFDVYNVNNPASTTNFKGQTVPMTAFAALTPGRQYSLKLAVGDYNDTMFDSAVFIEGGSFAFGNQCQDNIQLVAFVDSNNNGTKDNGEVPFSQGTFNYVVNNDGNEIINQSSNGAFYIFPEDVTNSYDITFSVYPELATYFNTSTSFIDVVHVTGGANIYYFPIANPVAYSDVEVAVTSFQSPNPGFTYYNTIIYKNNGITPATGTLEFIHDSVLTLAGVSEISITPITNGFTFEYADLLPGETRTIYVYFTVPTIPTVSLGQMVTNTLTSTNTGDIAPANNSFEFTQEIVGSYDPNDKQEAHGGTIGIDEFTANDYLYYTIRFQNTGTANAQFVRLVDDLDTRFDATSIRMVAASHNYTFTRTDMNLVWKFDQINLPPQMVNEEKSNGFVQFKIKLKPGFEVGDIVPNTAEIYFDYNPAIVTNTFNTEFVETLGNDEFTTATIAVYPNPARDVVTISNMGTEGISQITIYEVSGKKVFSQTKSFDALTTINVSDFAKGIYLVEIVSENKVKLTKKLVIK
ncbi:DUF7619 domain-containing protein [Flavobacterium dankookense]|uniref:Putative secreted protein (Por secretion system target) n=1 Tax=Flavobacterium dankookense TaxID=706186 RepID=A0A4R6Q8V1_9FLAO|nr:choice-of-anchor L domain-containing protein [Flavobacterium dankookense]TDP58691.1 putative secreted protein (Por secretion system target) [Flavobacterium dankookense]